jgi:tetratricopeptide (TPR) repeat protein
MQATEETFSWYDVPADIKNLLVLAAQNWQHTAEADKYMNLALEKTGEHPDVLIAAYRYFFYKNNQPMALKIALKVLDKVKQAENLPDDWEQLKPILSERRDEPQIRLYLNAYAASGLVLAKLGEIEQAKEVTARVQAIDPKRESCATTVFEVLTRPPEEDE